MALKRFLAVFVLLCFSVATYLGAYQFFQSIERSQAKTRLIKYANSIELALERYVHLPVVLSLNPMISEALVTGGSDELNSQLALFAHSAGVEAIYLIEENGITIASSNATTKQSIIGHNYAFRPYFQDALKGELSEYYGIGVTTGEAGYFLGRMVRNQAHDALGVIVVKLNLLDVSKTWQGDGDKYFLANSDGIVILSSENEWLYKSSNPLLDEARERIDFERQFSNETFAPLDWEVSQSRTKATIDGKNYLYLSTANLPNSWGLHIFVSDDKVLFRALVLMGGALMLCGILYGVIQMRRVRNIRDALLQSRRGEEALRKSNERLEYEIEERKSAQLALEKTQNELERAGRLAALGQLASSVTHELGQPIAAMKNQIVASEMRHGKTDLSRKINSLVRRMEDITKQLKFFSRKGRDKFEDVDLKGVVHHALELLSINITTLQAQVNVRCEESAYIIIGNKLRLEQVVINIVRNALDAAGDHDRPEIEIELGQNQSYVWLEVKDGGHGLLGRNLEDLKEPFTTTKESGQGMGLGLTISAGIIHDHGGLLTAYDNEPQGAVFRAEFPLAEKTEGK